MKVFMTGTTGHAGGVALNHFVNEGHEVYALVRPQHIPNLARRERVHWVAAFDDHRTETVGMICQDFVGNRITGNQAGNDLVPTDWRGLIVLSATDELAEMGAEVHRSRATEVPGQHV